MAKQALAANRYRLWIFGQSCDFYPVTTTTVLVPAAFGTSINQKNQIILHGTAGHGSAEDAIHDPFNIKHTSAHFVVERKKTAQVARPPAAGADSQDTGLVDAVRLRSDPNWEKQVANHAKGWNSTTIGIEIVTASESMWSYNFAHDDEPTFSGEHHLLGPNHCPAPIQIDPGPPPKFACPHGRPQDLNHFIHLNPPPTDLPSANLFAADHHWIQDEQYTVLVLLLRYLCIQHRIPRQFFGRGKDEVFRHWLNNSGATPAQQAAFAPQKRLFIHTLKNYRGILVHRNVSPFKPCPGIVNRNRLYRGISDEWWLPVNPPRNHWPNALASVTIPRPYYSGPFWTPPYVAGQPTKPSHFRYNGNLIAGVTYHDADLNGLIDTSSYYDVDNVNTYYNLVETRDGGIFPMGANRVWHGGVHLSVDNSDPCVYAATGGTIVAARVSNNTDTENHPKFGSQRFVLIRHCIYRQLETDPGQAHLGANAGKRINYSQDPANLAAGGIPTNPRYVFSLYMHLEGLADKTKGDDRNPPWFNAWRRANPNADVGMDGEKGRVFFPNIQVSLGDLLGTAGFFRAKRMIHFEIIGHRNNELQGPPWNDARLRVEDTNENLICDVPTLDAFVRDRLGDGLDDIDVLAAAPQLRNVKALHKSEWALTDEAQITSLVPHPDRRKVLWPHFRRFSWVTEAIAANPALQNQLGDAHGIFWHYHPITFMQHINQLILGENRQISEQAFPNTNVIVDDDYFLGNFVNSSPAGFVQGAADAHPIRIWDVGGAADAFPFTRQSIACQLGPGVHSSGAIPTATHLSLALLDAVELVRRRRNSNIDIVLSHVCANHVGNNAVCIMNTPADLARHQNGLAIDIRLHPPHPPHQLTQADCQNLWDDIGFVLQSLPGQQWGGLNPKYSRYCGMDSQGNYPAGFSGIAYHTVPAQLEANLQAGLGAQNNLLMNLPPGWQLAQFGIHVELTPTVDSPAAADTTPVVKLRITLTTIYALNDQDWFGPGEWTMQASVSSGATAHLIGSMKAKKVNTGDILPVNWSQELSIAQGGKWSLSIAGVDEDLIWDDPLGAVYVDFDQNSTSPWGIGRWAKKSTNGSFAINVTVESLNVSDAPEL